MSVSNPRFPHTCTITRYASPEDPMEDEGEGIVIYRGRCRGYEKNTTSVSGEVITTSRGLSLPLNKDGWNVRRTSSGILTWRGKLLKMGDEKSYIKVGEDDADAIAVQGIPQEGDRIVINYGPYTEHGQVIDRMVANFHGTHLIWQHVKD